MQWQHGPCDVGGPLHHNYGYVTLPYQDKKPIFHFCILKCRCPDTFALYFCSTHYTSILNPLHPFSKSHVHFPPFTSALHIYFLHPLYPPSLTRSPFTSALLPQNRLSTWDTESPHLCPVHTVYVVSILQIYSPHCTSPPPCKCAGSTPLAVHVVSTV